MKWLSAFKKNWLLVFEASPLSLRANHILLCCLVTICNASCTNIERQYEGWACESTDDCIGGYGCDPETKICSLGVGGGRCVNGECNSGYACRPFDNICVGEVISAELPCAPEGSFLPCQNGETNCEHGCRVCTQGTWSECRAPGCDWPIGSLHACSQCGDDCETTITEPNPFCNTSQNDADDAAYHCDYQRCGDGRISTGEECDDGNEADNDGCGLNCIPEPGWTCINSDSQPSQCTPKCGDGIVRGLEGCDDKNVNNGDGCDSSCIPEPGWTCSNVVAPSKCDPICGDGLIRGNEQLANHCDDGNTINNDGCTNCVVDDLCTCTGEPSDCNHTCRDGDLNVPAGELYSLAILASKLVAATSGTMVSTIIVSTVATTDSLNHFSVHDRVLLLTTRDAVHSNITNIAGQWEVHKVLSVQTNDATSDIITLSGALNHNYLIESGYDHQVIRIAEYTSINIGNNASLTATPWDSTNQIGGVLALRAKDIILGDNAVISMSEAGMAGGIAGISGPEGPRGRISPEVSGGNGGKGGSGGWTMVGEEVAPGQGNPGVSNAGGGGSAGSVLVTAAGGPCGGGGGAGAGGIGGAYGGQGAGKGGDAPDGPGGYALQEGAGGGGCPPATPVVLFESNAQRLFLGSGSAAGASGGCSESPIPCTDVHTYGGVEGDQYNNQLGCGGEGGLANGANPQDATGTCVATNVTNGANGGGVIFLVAESITIGNGASIESTGGTGGRGLTLSLIFHFYRNWIPTFVGMTRSY
ncbi:MAG: DUF4215 domain-containing protein, partial [Deltaproteobacteria bacterium]|nr:DUF4215 domain-containing protein [Deltaproteobacteria bacterium]